MKHSLSSRHYDRMGLPIALGTWAEYFEDDDYRCVAYYDQGGYVVSTIWLGIDHSTPGGGGPPLIFETMVIKGTDEPEMMYRTSTEEEAFEVHTDIVLMLESAPLEDLHEDLGDGEP